MQEFKESKEKDRKFFVEQSAFEIVMYRKRSSREE